jgi:hypothetical protein
MNKNINKFDIIYDEEKDDEAVQRNSFVFWSREQQSFFHTTQLVKNRLHKYLGFKIDDLLKDTDAIVYGGAIRDSLADLEIHDVDIMALPDSCNIISNRLKELDFRPFNFASADIMNMYKGLDRIINEPLTFIKNNTSVLNHTKKYSTIVQLIRPVFDKSRSRQDAYTLQHSLVSGVDLSCCGVAYEFGNPTPDKYLLYETVTDAFDHCKRKVFKVLSDNTLYRANRIDHRIAKLMDRGWKIEKEEKQDIDPFAVDDKDISGNLLSQRTIYDRDHRYRRGDLI